MRCLRWLILGTLFAAAIRPASWAAADGLSVEEFRQLHAELQPSPEEAWRTIPWKIDLLDAQQTAAEEGKPIFIWAMDGHPLGCT